MRRTAAPPRQQGSNRKQVVRASHSLQARAPAFPASWFALMEARGVCVFGLLGAGFHP